ncbi:MAG: TonB-dependent receptor [Acidobacteria bacterium]|nr:TonB-dependent receptor [Acidobacteriota bacterium]
MSDSSGFKRLLTVVAAALLAFSTVLPARAQNAAVGNITGTVTDATGAAVPGATVTVLNNDTGATRSVTTGTNGDFAAPFLQPGHYEVIFSGAGFGKVDRKNLVLTVGQTLAVDATLPNASASSEITVTDASPLIDTEKSEVSQTVGAQLVSNLPVNGRRWDNFVLLTPNVVPDGNTGLISYRGISGLYNTNLVDGTNNQQAFFSEARGRSLGAPYVFSQDSIKEFQSSASGYSAEFGQAAGGQINAITRSGTNAVHGDLFYYLRYPSLNALDPFAKFTGRNNNQPFLLQPTVHQQQQFGGSVGGPIIKDKLFYFFTYDGFRKVNPILFTSSVPSATILGYATTSPSATCPAGVTYQQCLAAAQYIVNSLTAFPRDTKQDIFFPRLDYQLNDKNHLSASFNWQNFKLPNGYRTDNTRNNDSNTSNGRNDFHERFLVANWESVVTANSANALHFQWSRDLETSGSNAPGPATSISGLFSYGGNLALPRPAFPDEHRWQVADVYSITRGKHSMKAGVDLNFIHEYIANLFQGNGNYTYSGAPATAFGNWVQDVYGLNGARHYNNYTQVADQLSKVPGSDDFWNKDLSAFAEDSWKVVPTLTVTAGVRYDTQLVPQPPRPYTTSANGQPSPLGRLYTSTININYKMFQPRLGFSWSPMSGTVVRGGYGMFYGLTSNSTFYALRVENGVFQQQYNFSNPNAAGAPAAPNVIFTPPGPALAAPFAGAATPQAVGLGNATLPTISFRGLSPSFSNPFTHSMDLGVEQELPLHSSLSLGYVGTRGMRLPYFIDVNQPAPSRTQTYDVYNATGTLTRQVTVPFSPAGSARPSPGDGSLLAGFSGLNSWYHSLAVTVRKPMGHGVELLVNYTWAKAMDNSQVSGVNGTFNGTNIILDPTNLKNNYPSNINMTREYSRSDLDMRSRFVGSLVATSNFTVPAYARHVVNGWTLSGTYTAQSGIPLTAFMSNNPSSAGAAYAGLDGTATGLGVNLNNAPGGAFGRAPFLGRNAFVYRGVRNLDARLSRDFPIHESIKFQILMEAFNAANRRQVLGVSSLAYSFAAPLTAGGNARIVPYTATAFGTPTQTTGVLYGPRQLQFAAKLFF